MAQGMARLRRRQEPISENDHRHAYKSRQSVRLLSLLYSCAHHLRSNSAYDYRILLVHTLPSSSPEARSAAVDAIAAALRIPTVFDFDTLYNLDPIIAVRDHELFSLAQIFLRNGLSEFKAWVDDHATLLETYRECFSAYYVVLSLNKMVLVVCRTRSLTARAQNLPLGLFLSRIRLHWTRSSILDDRVNVANRYIPS